MIGEDEVVEIGTLRLLQGDLTVLPDERDPGNWTRHWPTRDKLKRFIEEDPASALATRARTELGVRYWYST